MPRIKTSKKSEKALMGTSKAIVVFAFRNTILEDYHAGKSCPICEGKSEYSHLTENEMKALMKEAVDKIYLLLKLSAEKPEAFMDVIQFNLAFVSEWDEPKLDKKLYNLAMSGKIGDTLKSLQNSSCKKGIHINDGE